MGNLAWRVMGVGLLVALLGSCGGSSSSDAAKSPNILFLVLDDVGIDQMQIFGYGGSSAPLMPNINALARAGLRFRNTWSMPECSPGRAAMFVGRYPLHRYPAGDWRQ